MTRRPLLVGACAAVWLLTLALMAAPSASGQGVPTGLSEIGDERAIRAHVDQAAIDAGHVSLQQLIGSGRVLFEAAFTTADGQGRPLQNGVFPALARNPRVGPDSFNRISAPDADSCSGCHNKPRTGGGGDNVANVFVLGQRFAFFDDPTQPDETGIPAPGSVQGAADERNTLGMFGSGAIEMLAREMSSDMIALRERAKARAAANHVDVTVALVTKGIEFGTLTAHPDGTVDTTGVEGVDGDLIIKPFHQKGVAVSVRQFTNNAFPHHHGMQPVERFGLNTDSDGDGVVNELTVGDITAATIFQVSLGVPGRRIPRDAVLEQAIFHGEQRFSAIGCAECHRPALKLRSRIYSEPNPFNPPFNLRPKDVARPFRFDLTRQGEAPRLRGTGDGGAIVRAFTDLKRHDMGTHPFMTNERVIQGGVPTNVFITKKLWGFSSEPHFLHSGHCTLISEAILAHGGEAQAARDAFAALSLDDQKAIIEFLKSLQILPPNAGALIVDERGRPRLDLLRR